MKNTVLLLLTAVFFLLTAGKFPFVSAVLCAAFWKLRTDESLLPVLAVILILSVPRCSSELPETNTGTIREIRSSYCVAQNGRYRFILYTDEVLPLDAEVEFEGTFSPIDSADGFYRFHFDSWCRSDGIFYECRPDRITVRKENFSVRRMMQKRIEEAAPSVRPLLYRGLLNIRLSDEDSLYQGGFSFTGIFMLAESCLKPFLERKKRRKTMILISFLTGVIFRFPVLVLLYLFSSLLSLSRFTRAQKTSGALLLTLLVRPGSVRTVSFLFPAVLRIASLNGSRFSSFTCAMLTQSVFCFEMKPLQFFLYPLKKLLSGLFWLICLLQFVLIRYPFPAALTAFSRVMGLGDRFALGGSAAGAGAVLYLLLCMYFSRRKNSGQYAAVILLVFQLCGLFHPLAEVTFINVGQGDSILVRMPLNSSNILIDTGKPSQEVVLKNFLKAKGIRKIHHLIITHSDDDHSGNMNMIIDTFHPDSVITEHTDGPLAEYPRIFDLNHIKDDDENRSSLIQYFSLNGLKFLLMADADEQTEKAVISEYPELQCDILKLSHHGSKTGSSDLFLDAVKPEIAVISAGSYSLYHHPSPEVMQRLLKRHIVSFNTREEGDITILCFHGFSLLITAGGKITVLT